MAEMDDGEIVRAESAPDPESQVPLSVEQIRDLEKELRPLVEPDPVNPKVHTANVAIGVADELGRLVLSLVGVAVVLVVVAVTVTPWLWIVVAFWIGVAAWTIAGLRRRQRNLAQPAIKP